MFHTGHNSPITSGGYFRTMDMRILKSFHKLRHALRRTARQVKGFATEAKGATAVLFSLLTVVVIGSVAFGVDTATWYQKDRQLQTAADMAAMAVAADTALQTASGYNGDSMTVVAQDALTRAGVDLADLTILQVNSPPTSGTYAGNTNAVEVVLSANVPIFFAGAFVSGSPQARARAVALSGANADLCVLALHPTISSGILFSGSSDIQLDCGVGTNSNDSAAIKSQGSTDVQVPNIRAVGGIDDGTGMTATLSPYANPVPDPFEGLAFPTASACDYNNVSFNGQHTNTISPGTYCGNVRFNSQSKTTLSPGEYIIDGGDLVINGQAKVYGTGVTIFFTNSSNPDYPGGLQANGGSDIQLTAPTAGTYTDVLFMRDPSAADVTASNSYRWIINGSSDPWFDGAIYAPGVEVEMSGSSDPTGGCFVIIAGAVTFTGSVDVQMSCIGANTYLAGAITTSLVE